MSLLHKRKLLIADDSVAVQKIVQLTFNDEGYTVTAVGDGRRALEQIEQDVPDVVLADVTMPELNGYQVCARIKRDDRLRRVKVILLVGAFEPFNKAEARKVGADDFLTKPFQSIREMVNRVSNLFGGGDKHETAEHEAIPIYKPDRTNRAEHAAAITPDAETTATVAATTMPLSKPLNADELNLTSDSSFGTDAANAAAASTDSVQADHSSTYGESTPPTTDEFSYANSAHVPVSIDGNAFDEKSFDLDDDRNIDVTPFGEVVNHDPAETGAVETPSRIESTNMFFGDDAPLVDAYAEATNSEPRETTARFDFETTTSDEPNMSLTNSAHAPNDVIANEDALLDLDDFLVPTPHAAVSSSQTMSAAEVARAADSDDGLLDLDIDVPSTGVSDFSDALGSDERIPLNEIFPPRTSSEGETTESVLAEAMPVDAPSPFVANSNDSFNETAEASSLPLTGANNVAPQIQTSALITLDQLAPEAIEEIVRRVVEQMSERVVQEVAWEVVPELAERMIKRRLETDDGGL